MIDSLDAVIALLLVIVATISVSTLVLPLAASAWAHRRPSQHSALLAFVAALPACAVGILLAAVRLSLHDDENDRILFPLTAAGSLLELGASVVAMGVSSWAARRAGARPPLSHPLGALALGATLLGTLGFVWMSWD